MALCLALLATGCSEDSLRSPNDNVDSRLPITLSAAYPALTRASDAGFEDGNQMGVFVLDYSDNSRQDINGDDVHAANVRFKFNGNDNTWSGASTLYWTSNDTPADIIGYYPFVSSIDNPSSVPFSISRQQDQTGDDNQMGGYEASDFLWAKAEKVMPTDSKVDLTFQHKMAGIRVTLQEGTGFADGEWAQLEKVIVVPGILPNANINLANGEVGEASGSRISVVPYKYNSDWRAVVVPQSVPAGSNVIDITVDGVSYHLVKAEAITYVSGKLNSFTITVDKRSGNDGYEFKLTDEAITAWIDDVEFRDGIMRDYVVVNIEKRGTFSECIQKMGLKDAEIANIKIVGELDEQDFQYIRENLTYMKSLNLYDSEVFSENQSSIIPPNALSGLGQLNHIVFPKHLTIIGSCAFSGCGLMGDLIIPEGVTHIGTNDSLSGIAGHWGGGAGVFTDCFSLVGSLSLPSTLKFIEIAAFCRTSLSGELIIPESVRFIGAIAFDSTDFTSDLSLPSNIEEIGSGAFFRVPLTGNLVIPQGIKIIREQTFSGGDYSLLSLPEGLVEIEDEAFGGCGFKGELKLPSTIKSIGNRSFENNKFSSIIFPEKLSYMGSDCFANNSRLSGTLIIPDGITSINHGTFANCTLLDEVIIGANITKIEGDAFGQCYNLSSIIINNPEPPLLSIYHWDSYNKDAFWNIPKDNFTLQVPEQSIELYSQSSGWKEFKRIAAYSNFVCRPSNACALTTEHQEYLVLNSDGAWEITHCPDWCSVSQSSGNGKTQLNLTIKEMSKGSGNRSDYVEFSLKGTEYTTRCTVNQYDYEYDEDECIELQRKTKGNGNGVDVVFLGDGFDAKAISEGSFISLVEEQMDAFFGIEPYSTYQEYFNVYACISLSQETGVNTANTWRNTKFNTIYADGNLIHDDIDAVFDYAIDKTPLTKQKLPESIIIMSLNSDEYGGATSMTWNGSTISICSRSSDPYPMDTRGIVQHEACGHGFGKLAEERIVANRYLHTHEKNHINNMLERGWYQNISLSGKMAEVPWSHFIFDSRYSVSVDVYEGAFGVARGVFRSELNSCMNYGIPYFNAISRQEIMKRILDYSGEGFSMEKFYATDSDKWGSTGSTRAAMPDAGNTYVGSGMHHPVRIVKSKKY